MSEVDLAVEIRDRAVQVLIEQNTLAGDRVEAERVDPVESGDTPRIIVFADETANTDSQAGTAPAFGVTLNLAIDCLVEHAQRVDVMRALDLLVYQVKEALFGDAAWVKLSQNLGSYRTARKFEGRNNLILGTARILIACTWRATYRPRIDRPLKTITLSPLPTTPPHATPLGPPSDSPTVKIILPT
jgi:hypothetical protein